MKQTMKQNRHINMAITYCQKLVFRLYAIFAPKYFSFAYI